MKKGQGISLNAIVIAAIALLVLIILTVMASGKLGLFGASTSDCEAQGGECMTVADKNTKETKDPSLKYASRPDLTCEKDINQQNRFCYMKTSMSLNKPK